MAARGLGLLGLVALIAVSCGDPGTTTAPATTATTTSSAEPGPIGAVVVPVAARVANPGADQRTAGAAITDFGVDLLGAVTATAPPGDNVTVSPASVAYTLAMLEPGTVGDAQTQIRNVLHIDDTAEFHESMNALQQALESRVPTEVDPSGDPGEVAVRVANAAYLQRGYQFVPGYLDSVGSNYGPVLHEVDFTADPDAVAHEINAFVADATNDRIPQLVPDGAIDPDTVLALVNALYLKASWLGTFEKAATADTTFTRLDGSTTTVPMMNGTSEASASGDGWVGASKEYTGGLVAQFILPDEGRFDEIAGDLDHVFADYATHASHGAAFGLPRFDLRFGAELTPALNALGLVAPYEFGGLLGISPDPQLIIDQVIHQTDVAMDEDGTEAAAATVVLLVPASADVRPPVPVVLDRPFLYRIVDIASGATLFIGQVMDPADA